MKKFVAMLLAVCMSLSLVACGDSGTVADETSSTAVSSKDESRVETSSEAESDKDSSSDTESEEKADSDNESSTVSSEEESESSSSTDDELSEEYMDTTPTIEETVLWDEQNVKVTAISLTYTDDRVELLLRFENNSDKTLEFYEDEDIINGYTITSGYIRDTVEAGETVEDSKRYRISDLHECGITQIADISFSMTVYIENQTEHYADLASQSIQTNAAQSYDYDTDSFEKSLVDGTYETLTGYEVERVFTDELLNNYNVVVPTAVLVTDSLERQLLLIEIDNQSAEELWIPLLDLYINDTYITDGIYYLSSLSDTRAIVEINIDNFIAGSDETIDEDIRKVAFGVEIYNYNSQGIRELLCEAQQITFEF